MIMIVCELDIQLPVQSVPITTKFVPLYRYVETSKRFRDKLSLIVQ
jgi:hypothetical protein